MIQNSEDNILSLNFIPYYFENMSGMNINYHKSEVYVIGGEEGSWKRIAANFNCKLGTFPMVYLCIPIHPYVPRKYDLQIVNHKLNKRRDPWQERLMLAGA